MFITENMFIGLKTDVYIGQVEKHKVDSYIPRSDQIPKEYNDLCSSTRSVRSGNIR
jgi:hypothetical protein